VLTPLVLEVARRLRLNPVPYLLAFAMASNVGSVATLTGNPQNMIIGSMSHIPYAAFATALGPVAAIGFAATVLLIGLGFRADLAATSTAAIEGRVPPRVNRALAVKSVLMTAAMVVLFFLGQPPAKVAIVGGSLLLPTRRVKAPRVYREIDGLLLLMFTGFFIVVADLEKAVLLPEVISSISRSSLASMPVLGFITAALSNIVSNVPCADAQPMLAQLSNQQQAWLMVAMASTLAGNLTMLGSVANLIVVEQARRQGLVIGFWIYAKIGAPLTVLSIVGGLTWLSV
jgi:Na+/H+ antiporter NhaD/arsenite permease-like protein